MDELASRAKAVGGWQALARILDAELKRTAQPSGGEKKRPGAPTKDRFDLDVIGKLPFPHYGGTMSKNKYIAKYRQQLIEIFGHLSDRSFANEISKLRKSCPPSTDGRGEPMTEEEWYEAFKKVGYPKPP